MFLTARTPILLAVGIVPIVLLERIGVPAWVTFGAWILLVGALVAADVALANSPRRALVHREVPSRARQHEPVRTQVWLTNPTDRRMTLTVRDAWQPTAGAPTKRERMVIPPGERRSAVIGLRPRRRGSIRSEFVAIRALGPLGLAGRQAVIPDVGEVRVLPPFTSRRHLPSRLARLKELDGNTSVQVRGQGTEFDSLREYVRGDDVRSIDWRATARASTTMLRTWRPERDRHVVILIDTGRTAAARVGDGTRLDASMEAALLLSALATRAGDHVHLLMFDRVVRARVTGVDGAALLPALSDAMAPVEPQLIDTDWDAAFAAIRTLANRPSLIVVLTAQDEPDSSREFLGSLALVARGSRLIVGTATDTDLETVSREREDADGVYRAASAAQTAYEAARVARAVERAGGDAIADDPETLPPRVADRYLELKRQGRL